MSLDSDLGSLLPTTEIGILILDELELVRLDFESWLSDLVPEFETTWRKIRVISNSYNNERAICMKFL